jgi:hypothetical protein
MDSYHTRHRWKTDNANEEFVGRDEEKFMPRNVYFRILKSYAMRRALFWCKEIPLTSEAFGNF